MARPATIFVCPLLLVVGDVSCSAPVKIDIESDRLCLNSPAQRLSALYGGNPADGSIPNWNPGRAGFVDGGSTLALDAGLGAFTDAGLPYSQTVAVLDWHTEVQFNAVLAQLPSAAASLSADVRLKSMSLVSSESLDFIDQVVVTMSNGTVAAQGARTSNSGNSNVDASIPSSCAVPGFSLRVAYFQRAQDSATGSVIELTRADPDRNIFDCMKDKPTQFDVKLTPHAGYVPTSDPTLTLATCVAADTHVSLP
jgi:hypothetical protein